MNKKINFIYPQKTTSVSLTGNNCQLNCPYCKKHYLKTMKSIDNVDFTKIDSILISGGVDSHGKLPFECFPDFFNELKKNNVKINLHSGIIKESKRLDKIKKYVDCISFDFIFNNETIKTLYKDFYTQKDFLKTLDIILDSGIRVVPHIVAGIDYGKIVGEFESIDYISQKEISELAFLVIIPNFNTDFADIEPPEINKVKDLLGYSVNKIKKVTLGCMRPGGLYRKKLDCMALITGVNSIVMPNPEAVMFAKNNFYDINNSYECCVF